MVDLRVGQILGGSPQDWDYPERTQPYRVFNALTSAVEIARHMPDAAAEDDPAASRWRAIVRSWASGRGWASSISTARRQAAWA